jgi:Protein of unknown function (DUF3987)
MSRKASRILKLLTPPIASRAKRMGEGYQPFPVEVLPAAVGAFVREGARALGCDAACLAVPALAVVAGAIGNSRILRLKEGTDEPCVIWSAVVGEGDTTMTAALRLALTHLVSRQKKAFLDFQVLRERHREALADRQNAHKRAIDIWGELLEEMPQGPVLQWLVCGQTAVDKLGAILEQNPRGVLVARNELDGWLASFLRARSAGGRDPSLWLEMQRAGSFYFERTSGERGPAFVPRAAVSLTGVLSPGVLGRVLKADAPPGAVATCFLLAMPPRVPMLWSPAGMDEAAERAFHELLDKLLQLKMVGRDDERTPQVVPLSAKATAAWAAFYNAREEELAAAEGVTAAALGRMTAYAARLALIDHVVRGVQDGRDEPDAVGRESIEAGATLCHWFTAETQRVYAKMFESADERNAAGLVAVIRRHGGQISVRELMRSFSQRYPDVASAELALDRLVELGLGRWLESCQTDLTA